MRLNLPVQGAVNRLREQYEPFLVKLGEFDKDGKHFVVMGPPGGNFGPLPEDPGALLCRDARGWHCQPATGCLWIGPL